MSSWNFYIKQRWIEQKKEYWKFASCARFSEFYAGNVILFQIKVNARNIKGTTLAKNFKSTISFTRLESSSE